MHACIYTGHKPWLSFVNSGVWDGIVAACVGWIDGQEEAVDEDEVRRVESDAGDGPNCHLLLPTSSISMIAYEVYALYYVCVWISRMHSDLLVAVVI